MHNLKFYLALVLILVMSQMQAKAGTDKEFLTLMEGKTPVYQGVCNFRKDGTFTFNNKDVKYQFPCIVGMALPDQTKHYLVILNDKGMAQKVILFDEKTKKEKTLWTRGTGV
jgi:hypothetical protein